MVSWRTVIVVLVALGATVLGGCGSSSKKASTTTTTAAPSTSASGGAPRSYGNCGHGPGSACDSPASAHITVTPDNGLATGRSVTAKLTGFLPNAVVGIEECVAVVRSNNNCDTNTAVTGHTDASGAYTGTITLINPIKTTQEGTVTCGSSGNCSIGASDFAAPNALPSANEDVGFSS